jgi:rhodanese-related sulfurtransferase
MTRFTVLLLCCFLSSAAFSQKDTTQLSPDQFEKAIAKAEAQVVDVRTPEEYAKGHIQNSVLANWKNREEFEARTKTLDKSKPVYLYCLAGARSHSAAEFLRTKGYTQVYELAGGISKWNDAKKPLQE